MSEDKNVETVKQLFESYVAGDLKKVISANAPDVEITAGPRRRSIPWSGTHKGTAGAETFFRTMDEHLEYQSFEALEYIAQGDKVVVIGRETWRAKQSGVSGGQEWALVLTVRAGQIARMRLYEDTAGVAAAVSGKPVA